MGKTRVYFITDVHGSTLCFRKFLNASKFYKANVLILGGDITGKTIVPVIAQKDGSYLARHMGSDVRVPDKGQLEPFLKQVGDSGAYPYVTTLEEYSSLQTDKPAQDRLFATLIKSRLKDWMRLAEERLPSGDAKCYISPGNDDSYEIDETLNSSAFVINPEEKVVKIDDDHEMVTLGVTNHTPWHSPREVDEEELSKRIEKLTSQLERPEASIFNFHVPPIDTPIDQAPKVSEDLKYVAKVGQVEIISAGSKAVRSSIEKVQPMLGLHGHIHESRGVVNIGRTVCANPGSEYGEGILRGFLADLEREKIQSYLLTSG